MTKKLFFLASGFFFVFSTVFAQEGEYEKIKKEYESFGYENVIQLSDNFVKQDGIADSVLTDVYLMRAVSFYSVGDEISARVSFTEILKINKNYPPNPAEISPKLISIFNEVKTEYMKSIEPPKVESDSLKQILDSPEFLNEQMRQSILRNIALPGWGQLYKETNAKGFILSAASTANLVGMIYFIINTNKKENDYLNETGKTLIQQKYDDYNQSYKTRNILIFSYAALWIYSQIDLLLSSRSNSIEESSSVANNFIIDHSQNKIWLGYKISF
ncbi:MAG: hypothetical protein HYS25_07680 [Ignavibacteriales bacterium]|nr:hypothetical protein [Ignavibacteriales bacterium]